MIAERNNSSGGLVDARIPAALRQARRFELVLSIELGSTNQVEAAQIARHLMTQSGIRKSLAPLDNWAGWHRFHCFFEEHEPAFATRERINAACRQYYFATQRWSMAYLQGQCLD